MKKLIAGSVAVMALAAIVPLTAVQADEHRGRGHHGEGRMMHGDGDGRGHMMRGHGDGHMMRGDGEGRGHRMHGDDDDGRHMNRHHGDRKGRGHGGRHAEKKARIKFMEALERFDANDDGNITQEEVDQFRAGRLKQFDADGNGQLSLEEYKALWLDAMHKRMVRRFQSHDEDGDGQITVDEFGKRTKHMVLMRDRNDDGILNQEDLKRGHMHGRGKGRDGMMRGGMMRGDGATTDDAGSGESGEKSE